MYQQVKGKYQIKDDDPAAGQKTREALRRIELAEAAMQELEPKLMLAFAGEPVEFSDQEAKKIERIAAMFPVTDDMPQLAVLEQLK